MQRNTVTIGLPDAERLAEMLDWLQDDHLGQVVEAGALRGEASVLDADGHVLLVRES